MIDMKRIVEIINSLGIKPYTFDYSIYTSYVFACMQWYRGKTPYHTCKRYNGSTNVTYEKAKLHMAKRISEDIASLVCNQNMMIRIDSKPEADYLLGSDEMTGILGQNNFWAEFNRCFELTAALGTGALEILAENLLQVEGKLVANKNTKIKIARYDALHILPLTWDNLGNILEVAFIDEYRQGNDTILELRLHVKNEQGNYVVINKKCKMSIDTANSNVNKFVYVCNEGVIEQFDTGSNIPLFTCVKMPQINSFDINSPMGASAYGDAVDELKAVDDAFNTLCGEFRYSAKKVFYNKTLLDRDKKGNVIIPDDDESNKQVFYFTGSNEGVSEDAKDPIHEYNPDIRTKELTEGIELVLDVLSFKCGLGHGYYKFSSGTVQKTATEVISANSDLYRNICKMQLSIEKNIYDIIHALLYLSNYIYGTKFNINCKMSIDFDASIIEDSTAERERALKEVELNLLTPNEYRARYYPELGDIKSDGM